MIANSTLASYLSHAVNMQSTAFSDPLKLAMIVRKHLFLRSSVYWTYWRRYIIVGDGPASLIYPQQFLPTVNILLLLIVFGFCWSLPTVRLLIQIGPFLPSRETVPTWTLGTGLTHIYRYIFF